MNPRICFVTTNKHKIEEARNILPENIDWVTLEDLEFKDEIQETGLTFNANSFIKANKIYSLYMVPSFADDSGLVVEALNGAPGVYSARFAGPNSSDNENVLKLLKLLEGVENRSAYFETCICYCSTNGVKYYSARIYGQIALEPKGEMGFGYDPVFIPEGKEQTFAELGSEYKNKVSHRAKALKLFQMDLLTDK